jgi:hypothetical protein
MATYKVLQDIEAEDKLVGPLSLRQFIYGCITALCGYFCFIAIAKGVPYLLVVFVPPMLFTGFFAFPWSREQPTEVWALAKIRFMLKPRRRIWNQSGVKELVTVTAPKRTEKTVTNGLSQSEVRSRLNALANTIDSRGWAIKNVNVNLYAQPSQLPTVSSDRLVDPSTMPQEVSNIDVTASDDMLDEQNNPVAQQFESLLSNSSQSRRENIVSQLAGNQAAAPQAPADYWFLNQPTPGGQQNVVDGSDASYVKPQVVYPGSADDTAAAVPAAEPTEAEKAIIEQTKHRANPYQFAYSHLKNIQPLGSRPARTAKKKPAAAGDESVTATTDPAKIELARNNDLNISTIARLANKKDQDDDNEVVVPLR